MAPKNPITAIAITGAIHDTHQTSLSSTADKG